MTAFAAVVTLALGIGASTAVFSVVNAILLKPLPYPNADRIAMLWRVFPIDPVFGNEDFPWAIRELRVLLDHKPATFDALGAFKSDSFNLTGLGEPERLDGIRASQGFFPTLAVKPALGRIFSAEENEIGRDHVVILSNRLWHDRFAGDRGVLGRTVALNGSDYTVVGVMPSGFAFPRGEEMPGVLDLPREAQLWVPLPIPAGVRGPSEYGLIGRLKPGVDLTQAGAELSVIDKIIVAQLFGEKAAFSRVTTLAHQVAGDTRRPLLLILGAVGVVLLIACSNVASLLLTRSLGRAREFALRAALGAGRARLIQQLLTESLLLAAAGGFAGILIAEAAIHAVKILGPSNIPRLQEAALDPRVLAFATGITLVTAFFALAPALRPARENLAESLKEGDQRSGAGIGVSRMRKTLLVSQVALALVLTVSAGLLVRTFFRMIATDPGFQAGRVLTFQLSLPISKYPDVSRMTILYTRTLEKFRSLPGLEGAALVAAVPMGGATDSTVIRMPGHTILDEKDQPYANYTFCSPGYFSAVGTPLLRGRDFLDTDNLSSQHVTIINRAMAKRFWPGEDPIGQQVGVKDSRWPTRTIVGIVADSKRVSLREAAIPEMYVPYTQNEIEIWPPMRNLQVALRSKADPVAVVASVREALRTVDPELPLAKLATLSDLVDNSLAQPRFSVLLLGSFGALAVVLSCIGMYGAISYSVAQRTREIGTRMVLGAERGSVFAMVLAQGARLAGLGIAIGIAAALATTRLLSSFLYGVSAADPLTFAAVSLLLVSVALFACYFPARRAMSVDPGVALRHE